MSRLNWIVGPDGGLCVSGYPIRIRRGGPLRYNLEQDGVLVALPYMTLQAAKIAAEGIADELDEFSSLAI